MRSPDRFPIFWAAVALALLRAVVLTGDWKSWEAQIAPIAAAIQKIEPGSTLFAATAEADPALIADTPARRASWQPPLKHVAAFAVLGSPVFVPMVRANPTQQPLAVRPAYWPVYLFHGQRDGEGNPIRVYSRAAFARSVGQIKSNLDNRVWPDLGHVYLLLVGNKRLEPLPLPPGVSRAAQGGRFVLLRFAEPQSAIK